jgi:hypothetical protein
MNPVKIVAIVLIVAGALGLVYGTFSYTRETHDIKMGPMEMTVNERQTVQIPVWGGVVAIGVGALLLFVGKKG